MTIELIIFISIIFYALFYLSFLLKITQSEFKNSNRKDNSSDKLLPFSIIVAAKNEENNISNLISALKKLNYPEENYEVIIVDDNSIDDTFHLAKKLTNELGNFSIGESRVSAYIRNQEFVMDYSK